LQHTKSGSGAIGVHDAGLHHRHRVLADVVDLLSRRALRRSRAGVRGCVNAVGDDFQVDFTTWEQIPAGEVGDCSFRSIDLSLIAESGYAIGITPIVDGIALTEQTFSGATTVRCSARRSSRCAGRGAVRTGRTLSRSGGLTFHNVALSFVVLRATP
jgi:hypothetical protein